MGSCKEKITVPYVSVIMAVYNGERHLREAIESILEQSFTNFEFIIVNDGSRDKTEEILKYYAGQDYRIILVNQKNKGLTSSLNTALAMARGKYIVRHDADDISTIDRIDRQLKFLKDNPRFKLIGSGCIFINDQGREVGRKLFEADWQKIKRDCFKQNQFLHPSVMLEKSVFDIVGFYDERMVYGQDFELWLRVLLHYKGTNLPEYLVKKRILIEAIGHRHRRKRMMLAGKMLARFLLKERMLNVSNWWAVLSFYLQGIIPNVLYCFLSKLRRNKSLSFRAFNDTDIKD